MHLSRHIRILFFCLLSVAVQTGARAALNANYVTYINKYKSEAIAQMHQYHIPASITLAQGLLESAAGRSDLAQKSNNHFGIKCHNDWKGDRVYADDDKKGECFRKYPTVLDSYNDHSKFLVNSKRYQSLFELEPTDYKGWAKGLKAAGYATATKYAESLINLIETYDLAQYDRGSTGSIGASTAYTQRNTNTFLGNLGFAAWNMDGYVTHNVIYINGRMCIRVNPNVTLRQIAIEFRDTKLNLRHYNNLQRNCELNAGDIIFLERKKARVSRKELHTHQVVAGDDLWSISQQHGVRLKPLIRRNNISESNPLTVGSVLRLR